MKVKKDINLLMAGAAFVGMAHGLLGDAKAADSSVGVPRGWHAPPKQTADSNSNRSGLEEIVVTAQRRSEPLQNVPIAVNALSVKKIGELGVADITALSGAVPNLNISLAGTATFDPFIRGVGAATGNPNQEPSVATYVDGVYQANPTALTSLSFGDIQQIDVLKGPQGTLFGRNATAGVIQVTTKEPSQTLGGNLNVGYGNYNTFHTSAFLTGGVAKVAGDVAVSYDNQGTGYGYDYATGQHTFRQNDAAIRTKLVFTPSDDTKIHIAWDYSRTANDQPFQLAPGAVGLDGVTHYSGSYTSFNNWPQYSDAQQHGVSFRLDHDFGVARLVDIASYRRSTTFFSIDEDATPLPIVNNQGFAVQHDYTEELQLLSPAQSKFQWLTGIFYYNDQAGYEPITIAGLAAAPLPYVSYEGLQHTQSLSGYAQGSTKIAYKTKLTVGVRYTVERQHIHDEIVSTPGVIDDGGKQKSVFWKPTWRIALDHQFTDQVHGYVSYNRGVKSGGFDLFSPGAKGYAPEELDAYEVGLKSEFFNRRARLNLAAFYYDYSNIQVQQSGLGFVFTTNAAAARIYGLDLDFQAVPIERLNISGGLGLLNGIFTKFPNAVTYGPNGGAAIVFDGANHDIPSAPHVTANFTADYSIPSSIGPFVVSGSFIYNGGSYQDPSDRLTYPGYSLFNSSVTWRTPNDRWSLSLWAKNITSAKYYLEVQTTALGDLQMQAPPCTFGITASTNF
jgi:iron complex outermembrane receptor protein